MSTSRDDLRFGTRAVHAGQTPDPSTGAIMTPIYQTSTFVQSAPGVHQGHEYARVTNPTRTALEGNLAALEGAEHGIAFSSGVAAMDAILKSMAPGDHIVATNDLYGGSHRIFTQVWARFGLRFSFVDMRDADAVADAIEADTKMLWVETPTNPLVRIIDIQKMVEVARAASERITVVVDNTFASPYFQQPLALGADMAMHSGTKYLGGHSDLIIGAVCTSSDSWAERLRFQIKSTGAAPGPMDSFLALRGTKTLHLRMQRHAENAGRIARFLDEHPKVDEVRYPGLENFEGHEVAQKQMSGFGGMLSFTLADDRQEAAFTLMQSTRVIQLAESLGGVESLIEHPASMTHGAIPEADRHAAGLLDSLIRLSVGVEDGDDLLEDLEQALAKV